MRIDLHVHSNRSDGAFPPAEVVRLAADANLGAIALTDHDTTSGLDEARAAGERAGVEVLTGCEISTTYRNVGVHMLGYFFDPANAALAGELSLVRDDRVVRAERMVERLAAMGVPITFEQVLAIAGEATVGRPHIAQAMVDAGVIERTPDAFTPEWIANGGRAYVEKHAPTPHDAVRLVRDAGGVCVVAHPIWIAAEGIDEEPLLAELAEAGLAGIEVDHPEHGDEMRARYRQMAARLGLVRTGSSDFHGNAHGGRLGSNVTSPEALAALRERAAAR